MSSSDDDEPLEAWGSGNVAADLGIPNPEEMLRKWAFCRALITAMTAKKLDVAEAAKRAGVEPEVITQIRRGRVRDIDLYELMRVLSSLDYGIAIMIRPAVPGEGRIWIDEDREATAERASFYTEGGGWIREFRNGRRQRIGFDAWGKMLVIEELPPRRDPMIEREIARRVDIARAQREADTPSAGAANSRTRIAGTISSSRSSTT